MRLSLFVRAILLAVLVSGLASIASGQSRISIASSYPVSTLDPIKSAAAGDIEILGQLYARLLRRPPDGSELLPGLAESWEQSEDGLNYTFHLRDARFSDGTPITAEDVVFSFLRLRDQEDSAYNGAFQVIESIEAVDEDSVRFALENPAAPFLSSVEMFNAGIVPKHAVLEMGEEEFASNPVTSGPFMLEQWLPNDRIILQRNPHYWREGRPFLDEVEFIQVTDENARVAMILADEVDVIAGTPWSSVDRLKEAEGINVPLNPSSVINILLLNHSKPPFDDVLVRRAVALGVDVGGLVDAVTFGYGVRANSTLPNVLDYYHEDLEPFPYDPEQARELIQEAGAAGSKVEFMITSGSSYSTQVAQLVQAQLGILGLDVEIVTVDTPTWWDKVVSGDYGLSATWWYNETTDPDPAVRWALCGTCGNQSFYSFFNNEEINRLTEEGVQELDTDERREIYHQIQEIAKEEVAQVPLYYQPYLHAYRERVEGLMMSPSLQWSLEEAKIVD